MIQDALQKIVDEQAEDQGLWFVAESAPEGHLQEALRKLHKAIEGRGEKEEKEKSRRDKKREDLFEEIKKIGGAPHSAILTPHPLIKDEKYTTGQITVEVSNCVESQVIIIKHAIKREYPMVEFRATRGKLVTIL